jgi:predicted amidophosphoribosyltransferase
MAICPNCGNKTGESAIFCDQCGTRLPAAGAPAEAPAVVSEAPASVICAACGAANVPGEAFCDACGAPLEAPEPTAVEAPPVAEEAEAPAPVEVPPALTEAPPAVSGAVPEAPPAVSGAENVCPACGAPVEPDDAFCDACGASLKAPAAEEPVAPPAVEEAEAPSPPEAEAPAPAVEEAPPVVEAPPAPAAAPPAVSEAAATCPACGAEVRPGDAFCNSCGASLEAAPVPAPPTARAITGVPRLVVDKTGAEIPLPEGEEIILGREDPVSGVYPEVDTTPHDGDEAGVSRQHAKIRRKDGGYTLQDLDSTNFTFLNQQKLTPKIEHELKDGDQVRLGRLSLTFRAG